MESNLSLQFILPCFDTSSEAFVPKLRNWQKAVTTLCVAFQSMIEAIIAARQSILIPIELKKGENIVEYSSGLVEPVCDLERAEHPVSTVEDRQSGSPGLLKSYEVTVEPLMSMEHTYSQDAFTVVVVWDTHLQEYEGSFDQAVVMKLGRKTRECCDFRKAGRIPHNCTVKKISEKRPKSGEEKNLS